MLEQNEMAEIHWNEFFEVVKQKLEMKKVVKNEIQF